MASPATKTVAVVGSGPAGLMAALVCARAGLRVTIFEKKKGPGRKLLVAGSSGLNVGYDAPESELAGYYRAPRERIQPLLDAFGTKAWLEFIHGLGIETFLGTSRRYFVEDMKASKLLRAWLTELGKHGTEIRYDHELSSIDRLDHHRTRLTFAASGATFEADAVVLALGGGSWEPQEKPLRWPLVLKRLGLAFHEFQATNVGYQVHWPEKLLAEAEGKPLKNVALTTSRGTKRGDLVITRYGLEGTPIYYLGEKGTAYLDLKPDATRDQVLAKLTATRENLSPLRRVKKLLNLGPASFALYVHLAPREALENIDEAADAIKRFPLVLQGPQPLDEAISSSGGLEWRELDGALMLKRYQGLFAAGEMINWDAPTGGFLITGCVSQGFAAGSGVVALLSRPPLP